MKKYLNIIILICLSSTINAQLLVDTNSAKKLLNYEIEYWQSTDDSVRAVTLLKKVELYKSLDLYNNSIFELDRIKNNKIDSLTINKIKYEKLVSFFLTNNFNYCSQISINNSDLIKLNKSKEYAIIQLNSLNETENWKQCKNELINTYFHFDSAKISLIQKLPTTIKYINPKTCKRLSAVVPGLGETVAGYPIKGLTSFVIHSSLIYFIGYNYYYHFYFTGSVSGILPLTKFYGGGKRLSEHLAEQKNQQRKNSLKNKYSFFINEINHFDF